MPDIDFCITQALKASFEGLNNKAKNKLANEIKNRHKELTDSGLSSQNAATQLFKEISKEADGNAKFLASQNFHAALATNDILNFIDNTNEVDESKPLLAKINGTPSRTKVWARSESTNLKQKTERAERSGRFSQELQDSGVLSFYQDKKWMRDNSGNVFEEIRNPGGSSSPESAKIGEITRKHFADIVSSLHESGLPVNELEGFMGSYHRDVAKMMMTESTLEKQIMYRSKKGFNFKEDYELAYQRWKDTELQHLDMDRTFGKSVGNEKEIDEFMRAAYDNQVLDIPRGSASEKDSAAFRGLADITSRKKVLFYKDGWAFAEANKAYGFGDASYVIENTLNNAANMSVLAKEWSTQPYKVYNTVVDTLVKRIKKKPPHLRKKLLKNLKKVGRVFDELTGVAKIPEHASSANITNSVLCAEALSSFGSAITSAFNDIPGWMVQMHQSGEGYFRSFVSPFEHLVKRLTGVESTKKDLQDLGFWLKDLTGDVMSRMASADSLSGLQAKMMGTLFKLNILKPWDRFLVNGSSRDLARQLWRNSTITFNRLNPAFKFMLERYNINESEWDLIRKNSFQAPDGRKFITPDDPLDYSENDIKEYLKKDKITKKEYDNATIDIRKKLIAMSIDRAHFIYLDPDLTTQALMRLGTRPGTPAGNAVRLLVQAHAWPVGIVHRILGSILSNTMEGIGIAGKASGLVKDLPGLSLYVAGLTVTSYLSQSLKNVTSGKKLPKFLTTQNIEKTSSETLGVYGQCLEAMLGKMRYGDDPLINASGPAIRDADDLVKIISKAIHGQRFGSPLYHLIRRNIPGLNLIYVKPAFDYLIGYHIQEALFPGSLNRAMANHRRRVREEGEAEYFAPPTSALGV
jgi:hypothetical protein